MVCISGEKISAYLPKRDTVRQTAGIALVVTGVALIVLSAMLAGGLFDRLMHMSASNASFLAAGSTIAGLIMTGMGAVLLSSKKPESLIVTGGK